ncbi:hypothetical protein PHYBOEH_000070 [Phytophthora boehmeriae]|uniref:Ubiquitin carboxyl-terminal hydrolase n=1 Tax=Phytophthora boehmeriae TaxID=109152 RepID=A0A8T1X840_9STRA|nr:hypothetical protein PHYBOEH_000070 [Phytophthora boehmeriae]
MADLPIKCLKAVVLEVTRDDGEIERTTLHTDLVLKKEVGNARLVSGDSMLWVGKGVLTHKDSSVDATPARTVRVENHKRRFIFTVALDATGKQFYTELKDQVDGKAGIEVRKKKRKIRKQLSQVQGFTPVNTLKSPMKSPSTLLKSPAQKPPMTPKRSPLATIGTSQLTLPPPLPVTALGTKSSASPLRSPLRSPFRSPFRKKARHSVSPSSGGTSLAESKTPSSRSPAKEWLSPVRSLKLRSGPTPPDLKRQDYRTPEKQTTNEPGSGEGHRRTSITNTINKRVRSLQLMLDDESTEGTKHEEAQEQNKITSHFFKQDAPISSPIDKKSNALDVSMESAVTETEQAEDSPKTPSGATSGGGTHRSTHGLLNLGNYCYMNAIVQSLSALPVFVKAVKDEENLLKIIRKQTQGSVKGMTLEQLKTIFDEWRTSGDTKHLALQCALNQLLQSVIEGSEASINPEPLKNLMGKKNSIFATHFQQDAHEFLLNLVTEYEKELVETVHEVTDKVVKESKSSPQVQRSSLLNFFRSSPQANRDQQEKKDASPNADKELICRLPPAKCFRAEMNRTLTCKSCGYSRKQAETFYDFSLDLPYYPIPEQEPIAEQAPQELPAERQCFCKLDVIITGSENDRCYCCPKASCSYREKVVDPEVSTSPTKTVNAESQLSEQSSSSPAWPARPSPINLETLIQKQFESEVLELTCEKCKDGKEAVSAYQINSLPSVLVFHLKRFEVNPHTGMLFKRCDPVIPPAQIDPIHTINNSSGSRHDSRYTLKSVVHHLGKSIDEGHYVADVCDAEGQWIRRNDTHESKISEDYALRAYRSQESCYMFFYVKSERDTIRDAIKDGKENEPQNEASPGDENDESSSRQLQGSPGASLRAFL